MKPKNTKKLNFINEKRKPRQEINLSKYRKIYKITPEKISVNSSDNRIMIKKEKEKINKLKSLFGVYKNNELLMKQRNKWENLTKPKLPFSKRNILPKEDRLKKLEALKPSLLYHDNHVIHWIRNKYSSSVIEKSLYTILPEKEIKIEPEKETEAKRRRRKMLEYLKNLREPAGREKFVKIHPKYFYDKSTFIKIKKLKDIFMAFDLTGSGKMSLDDITSLFNQNNIKASEDDLVKLFFQDKNYKKKDYYKLYLSFYQFLKFALNKGQDFRLFMRKIKSKLIAENKKNKDNQNENLYLPMNLNLLLDYFIIKSKERASTEKIEKAMEKIDQVIKKNPVSNKKIDSNYSSSKKVNIEQTQTPTRENIDNEDSNLNNIQLNYLDESFENIDFKKLVDEFYNLFKINQLDDINNYKTLNSDRKNKYRTTTKKIVNEQSIKDSSKFNEIKRNMQLSSEFNKRPMPVFYEYSKNSKDIIGNTLKRQMNNTHIVKMNINNYKKYHNIELALEATKEQLEKMAMNQMIKHNNNYRLSKFINKSSSLNSFPLVEKRYLNPINDDKIKKSFLFKYTNISQNNSMKLFNKKELMNFNKNCFYDESRNRISNSRVANRSSNKFKMSKSLNSLDVRREDIDFDSDRKYDYVPNDLFPRK